MGGIVSSRLFSYSTPEEETVLTSEYIKRIHYLQEVAVEFSTNTLFYGIPVRVVKKSSTDIITSIWIEPIPTILDDAINGKLTENILEESPTGVFIDINGCVTIHFTLIDVKYKLTAEEVQMLDIKKSTTLFTPEALPQPSHPKLEKATNNSIHLSFRSCLPLPIAIIQYIEVQFAEVTFHNINAKKNNAVDSDDESKDEEDNIDEEVDSEDYRWQILVKRCYNKTSFLRFTFDHLSAGKKYRFRLRYHCFTQACSIFSLPSPIYRTLPTVPPTPASVEVTVITSFAVQLTWKKTLYNNGSDVTAFLLIGKGLGDDEFLELYRGPHEHYLLLGVFPNCIYSFAVAQINSIGISPFSKAVNIQTSQLSPGRTNRSTANRQGSGNFSPDSPSRRPRTVGNTSAGQGTLKYVSSLFSVEQVTAAEGCVDAWQEFFDPRTQQTFYFNTILGTRQLNIPEVLRGIITTEQNNQNCQSIEDINIRTDTLKAQETSFRRKRFQLLRILHQKKSKQINEAIGRRSSNDLVITITISRATLLQDLINKIKTLSTVDILKRWKFQLIGEEGIDSGGISKEVFLLFSKQIARYAASSMIMKESCGEIVNRNNQHSDDDTHDDIVKYGNINVESIKVKDVDDTALITSQINRNQRQQPKINKQTVFDINDVDFSKGLFFTRRTSTTSNIPTENVVYALGVLFAKALLDRQMVDFPFSRVLLHHLLGKYETVKNNIVFNVIAAVKIKDVNNLENEDIISLNENDFDFLLDDLQSIDKEYYQSMKYIIDHDITDILIDETFIAPSTDVVSSNTTAIPLCPRGDEIIVTNSNKRSYVYLLALWKLYYSVHEELQQFLTAFHGIIPLSVLQDQNITVQELSLLFNGKATIDVEELRAYSIYQSSSNHNTESSTMPFDESNEVVAWFWMAMREFTHLQRTALLQFMTGSSKVPLDGFDPPLTLTEGVDLLSDSLPRAHTCFHQLVLPQYRDYETLREKLLFAIENTDGFLLA